MADLRVLNAADLEAGTKKVVKAGETEILLIHLPSGEIAGVQPKCPHAGAPLVDGALCNGRLVCPWHMATFALTGGELLEPPAMEGLKRYPVRVADGGIFVDSEPLADPKPSPQPSGGTVLLAGAGAAAAMCARTLRTGGFGERIVAVDAVPDEPIDRTTLTKAALSGKKPLDKVGLGTFEADRVERISGTITEFSAASKQVTLQGGEVLHFDHALLATGGQPKRLDIPGADQAFVIRHTDDVKALHAAAEGKEVVIIGTSFIAMEAASSLVEAGHTVTVVGPEEVPFAQKLGQEVAQAVKALHTEKGTRFDLGVEVVRIDQAGVIVKAKGDGQGRERLVPGGVVVMGTGVEPALHFQHDLPISSNKRGGIAVDASLQAAPGVWVAGDIANVDGTRIEHWRLAEQHGMTVGHAILSQQKGHPTYDQPAPEYNGVPFFWTAHFGKRFGYLGHADDWDEIVLDGNPSEPRFLALYVKDNAVKAVLGCGEDHALASLAEPMRQSLSVDAVQKIVHGQ